MDKPLLNTPVTLVDELKSGLTSFTMFVCFLFTECRMTLMFYLGFKASMGNIANYVYTNAPSTLERIRANEFSTVAEIVNCINGDIEKAMDSLNVTYTGTCIQIAENYWGFIDLPIKMLITGLIIVELAFLGKFFLRCHNKNVHSTWRSGRYMSFVWRMYETDAYNYTVKAIQIYTVMVILLTCHLGFVGSGGVSFIIAQLAPLVQLIAGALGMASVHRPAFAKDAEQFHVLIFKRKLQDMLTQTVDQFAQQLEHALYRAACGEGKLLADMVDYQALGWDKLKVELIIQMLSADNASRYAVHIVRPTKESEESA